MQLFNRLIIALAYYLDTSNKYQKIRRFFTNLLENDDYKYKKYFDFFMMLLIVTSVTILIYEVKDTTHEYLQIFNYYVISFIFFIEYMLRLWIYSSITKVIIHQADYAGLLNGKFDLRYVAKKILKDKLEYIFSIKAIIDILAIMPFFHELRLLRIFVLFRVFKLFRYAKSFQIFSSVLANKKFEFLALGIFAMIVIFVSSILIYVMEANNQDSAIKSLFDAVYWSIVTISTVGYGDITPVTPEGRLISMFVILAGIAVLAFTTSLFVSAFTEKIDDIKEAKTIETISKSNQIYLVCGYDNIAKEVVKKLLKSYYNVIVLDKDLQKTLQAQKDGAVALNYNPGNVDSYKKLHIDMPKQVKAILCLREDDVDNVYTALTIRSMHKDIYIVSLLMNKINRKKLLFAGANEILYEKELVGLVAREYVGQPVAFEAIHALRAENNIVKMEEIVITDRIVENFSLVEELGNLKLRLVLLGIEKKSSGKFYFNPIGSTTIESGDVLLIIGNYIFIKEFEKYLHKKIRA